MQRHVRSIIVFFVLLFVMSFNAMPVFAESSGLKVTTEVGIDGKVKRSKGFPLKITIENSGASFKGDLLIDYYPSYNSGGALAVPIELPEKSTKSFIVSIPGMSEDHPAQHQNQTGIHLFRGDWKDGNKVSFKGDKVLKLKYIEYDRPIIGTLSENIDRLRELKSLSSLNGDSIELLELESERLPKQALGLEMLDYLLVDEFALAKLDKQQQEAIKTWVAGGGFLIAGGAPDMSQSFGTLNELLPVQMNGETQVNSGFLKNGKREDPLFDKLTVFTGNIAKEAEVLAASGETPVVVKKNYGMGAVVQPGFSLGDEPLSSWNGYADWFNEALIQAAGKPSNSATPYGQDIYSPLYYEFAEINEYFPTSQFSIQRLIGLLAGYFIILVPVLYFILKRLDKREHAWWIIPTISIIMSAAIFGIGAKDRIKNPQLNQMGVFVNGQGFLTGYQAATLLSNTSGTYSLSMPKDQFKAVPSTDSTTGISSVEGVFEETRKGYDVVYKNVEYWSSRTLYGEAKIKAAGHFQTELSVDNNVLKGTIQNNYPYDFNDILIWTGKEKHSLGPLKKGEVMQVNQKVKQSILSPPYNMPMQGYPMPNGQSDLKKLKQERLENAVGNFLFDKVSAENLPVLAGLTNDQVLSLDITGEKEKKHHSNLIIEPFKAEGDLTGQFTLTQDGLASSFNVINGRILEKSPAVNEILLEDGQYEYVLNFPKAVADHSILLDEIQIRTRDSQANFELYNYQKGEYVSIEQTTFKRTADEHAGEFLGENGKMMLRITKHTNGDPYVILPDIKIKGEVLP